MAWKGEKERHKAAQKQADLRKKVEKLLNRADFPNSPGETNKIGSSKKGKRGILSWIEKP